MKLIVYAATAALTISSLQPGIVLAQENKEETAEIQKETVLESSVLNTEIARTLNGAVPVWVEFGQKTTGADLVGDEAQISQDLDTSAVGMQKIVYTQEQEQTEQVQYAFVYDSQAPVIESNSTSISIYEGQSFSLDDFGISAYDPDDTSLSYAKKEQKGSYWMTGDVDTSTIGEYTFTITAMDGRGNTSSKKFSVDVVESPAINEAAVETVVSSGYSHSVNTSGLSSNTFDFIYSLTPTFLSYIRAGQAKLYYSCDATTADYALGEVVYLYCNLSSGGSYYDGSDEYGTYLELTPSALSQLQSAVAVADANYGSYRSQVANILYSLDLTTNDYELVNQINAYLTNNFTYSITNNGQVSSLITTGTGQCYHFAHLFADLCNSVGISCSYVGTADHAYNMVTIDGISYRFDPTYNNTSHSTAYSWLR
jgi:transglutaminase-like putative cysteine protease